MTFSFCNTTDECIQDVWNYFNMNCSDPGWKRAKDLSLEDCNAQPATCIDFESDIEKEAQYFNRTWTLAAQSYCTITVNAMKTVARVVFDNTSLLGVEIDNYRIGDVITVDAGNVQEVTIYNAADSGQLTFVISFSGAYSALSSIAAAAIAAFLCMF